MLTFKNAPLAITRNGKFISADYSAKVGKAIAAAIAAGDISKTGLISETVDDGNGVMIPVDGSYLIDNVETLSKFISEADSEYKMEIQTNPTANKESKVWLTGMPVTELSRVSTKITGKVVRAHVSYDKTKVFGVSLTLQVIEGTELNTQITALISADYLKPILTAEGVDMNIETLKKWATTIIEKHVILGYRQLVEDKTGYFKPLSALNPNESKAYAASDKTKVMKNADGHVGFIHRTSARTYTWTSFASDTETAQYETDLSNLNSLKLKENEKRTLGRVDNELLDDKNRINADALLHHMNTAKKMFDNKFIDKTQYDERVAKLLSDYGIKK